MRIAPDTRGWLAGLLGPGARFDAPMAPHTSFKVGGPAAALARPENHRQLAALIAGLRRRETPFLVVGGGTNLLVGDGGIPIVVILLTRCGGDIRRDGLAQSSAEGGGRGGGGGDDGRGADGGGDAAPVLVSCGAGARLSALCNFAMRQGLAGMAFALGIPGTVGGAIRMNAGTGLGAMADVLERVDYLTEDGAVASASREQLLFSYRRMEMRGIAGAFMSGAFPVILGGVFRLRSNRGGAAALRGEARAILEARRRSQPFGRPSAGCYFKNPAPHRAAGWLMDQAGLKGERVGGAMVSHRHANFIVNAGGATARDILTLADRARERVCRCFGDVLEPEVRYVGH